MSGSDAAASSSERGRGQVERRRERAGGGRHGPGGKHEREQLQQVEAGQGGEPQAAQGCRRVHDERRVVSRDSQRCLRRREQEQLAIAGQQRGPAMPRDQRRRLRERNRGGSVHRARVYHGGSRTEKICTLSVR